MIATIVHIPVLRCDSPAGVILRVSRQGYDTEQAARAITPAEHPGMLSVHDVIRVSYPVSAVQPPLVTAKLQRLPGAVPISYSHVQIEETRPAKMPGPPKLIEQQKGICFLCNQPFLADQPTPNLHHVIPASKGGRGLPANKVLTHIDCNGKYGNREPTPAHLDLLLEIYGRHAALATVHLWLARYPDPTPSKRKLHSILTEWSKANG